MADATKLKKNLTLFDVYAISTGAMFSSGFFLLPGLATAKAGPATVLAYFLAGIFILPAMFSAAELSTAMPKAGGAYYFLDRSLGPLAGTVGGLGTWLALVLKSAFALVGMGAYLVFFFDVPIKPLAVALTVAFAALNVFGAKETSGLQRILVTVLVAVLVFFVFQGLFEVVGLGEANVERQFTPFLPFGWDSLLPTIGLVFVSYAGLTKVASVAEEVQNPDRNIPLGMFLSLFTATAIYCVGVFIMIAVLDAQELRSDLTPVATAAEAFFDWLPEPWGLMLIVAAAIAAFASTGNAGILSASRYPLAMARDRLVTPRLGTVGRFGTPVPAIIVTAVLMIFVIVALDVEGIAKLASAFQLLLFGLLNVTVIVMRESRIPSYVPGYRSPLYPWMQVIGVIASVVLVAQLGPIAWGTSAVMIAGGVLWYRYYALPNPEVEREGAVYHLFERLGRRRYEGLDTELRTIIEEKGTRDDEAPFESLVTRATVIDLDTPVPYRALVPQAAKQFSGLLGIPTERIEQGFFAATGYGAMPIEHGAALPHLHLPDIERSELVMVRCRDGIELSASAAPDAGAHPEPVYAVFFLVSPAEQPSVHLRMLAGIASRLDDARFMEGWLDAPDKQTLRETLLQSERHLLIHIRAENRSSALIGKALREVRLPPGTLVALVRRRGNLLVPSGNTVLEEDDRVTVIGNPEGIARISDVYGSRDNKRADLV